MVLRAVDEGRAVHPPKARAEEDELAEEWSPEELSSAALLAASVLAKHGTGQVSCPNGFSCLMSLERCFQRMPWHDINTRNTSGDARRLAWPQVDHRF